MKQFEYRHHKRIDGPNLIPTLNALGLEGWEVVAFDYGGVVLKRQITVETQQLDIAERTRRAMIRRHLIDTHDHQVYIGDPEAIHKDHYPDCEDI